MEQFNCEALGVVGNEFDGMTIEELRSRESQLNWMLSLPCNDKRQFDLRYQLRKVRELIIKSQRRIDHSEL